MTDVDQLRQDSREALAQLEVGHTTVSRTGIFTLMIAFAVMVLIVPIVQLTSEWRRGDLVRQWGMPIPESVAFLHLAPSARELSTILDPSDDVSSLSSLRTTNARMLRDILAYEDTVEANSIVVAATIPPAQAVLTGWLKSGNENAYCGRDGWLYYRPDFDYATRAGFLEPKTLAARRASSGESAEAIQPDPVKAIVEFAAVLKERGIELIVFPAPTKATVCPEHLSQRYAAAHGPIQNPSFDEFKYRLENEGVTVFDPAPALAAAEDAPAYLATDTHWTSEAAIATAKSLVELITKKMGITPAMTARYTATPIEVSNVGDVAAMIKFADVQRYYPNETATIRQIKDAAGAPWTPDPAADILFLGDSFANIYSLAGMGWGESAGFAEQLSYELQHPIDAIRINDNGSHATRRELSRQLQEGHDRLAGKRVVIYEFAARELVVGDWETGFSYEVAKVTSVEQQSNAQQKIVVRGNVAAIAKTPQPGSVPYRDCVIALHLTGVQAVEGSFADAETLVFVWGMRNNKLEAAAEWHTGQDVTLEILPWARVTDDYGSYNRVELDDDALLTLEPYWGVLPGTAAPNNTAAAPTPTLVAQIQTPAQVPTDSTAQSNAEIIADLKAKVETLTASDSVVLRGAGDWLFFRPELRHLTVGKFWGDAAKSASNTTNPEYADPLAAIVDFNNQLKSANIELLLVPIPPKAAIYADKVSDAAALENSRPHRVDSTLQEFYGVLRDQDVDVLDLTDAMLTARAAGTEMFCRQDTHYSGEACALFAREIAQRLKDKPWLNSVPRTDFSVTPRTQEITGDLWGFLNDPNLKKEEVPLQFVQKTGTTSGSVESWRESPVLLLGDSHCLIFHEGGDMHATGAGLPDLLAKELGFAADLVAVRGSGATPARMNLVRRRDNLAGKKVVVWCFTAREFTEAPGGWRPLPVIQP